MNKICVRCGMEYPDHKMSCKIPVEEWRLPTAKEFIEMNSENHSLIDIEKIMIEFAKLHVEQALTNFLQEIEIQRCLYHHPPILFINKDSIKNAYSLNNVK
jgi:hypothetical protein